MQKSVHTAEYTALRKELCSARENAGLSQRDLAARLHVPHSWVAKVETGERRIDLIEFCRYFAACGADPTVVTAQLVARFFSTSAKPRKGGRSK